MARSGGRIDRDCCLLPLEFVYRADTRVRQPLLNFKDLSVVRCDDHDVVEREWHFLAIAIDPSRLIAQNTIHNCGDRLRFFRRTILIATVRNRQIVQARSA